MIYIIYIYYVLYIIYIIYIIYNIIYIYHLHVNKQLLVSHAKPCCPLHKKAALPPGARWTVAIALLQHLEVRQLQGDVILYSSVMPGRKWGWRLHHPKTHGIYEGFHGISWDSSDDL